MQASRSSPITSRFSSEASPPITARQRTTPNSMLSPETSHVDVTASMQGGGDWMTFKTKAAAAAAAAKPHVPRVHSFHARAATGAAAADTDSALEQELEAVKQQLRKLQAETDAVREQVLPEGGCMQQSVESAVLTACNTLRHILMCCCW